MADAPMKGDEPIQLPLEVQPILVGEAPVVFVGLKGFRDRNGDGVAVGVGAKRSLSSPALCAGCFSFPL
jgi:hypothetical protein